MKTIFRMMALFMLLFSIASCDTEEQPEADPQLEVNYANIAGTWRLAEWNGTKLDDSRYFYITFQRKATDGKRTYEIYQNFDSATSRYITGTFNLEEDEDWGPVITGEYDYWKGEWENTYLLTNLRSQTMVWIVKDNPEDISLYERCSSVPENIVKGERSID